MISNFYKLSTSLLFVYMLAPSVGGFIHIWPLSSAAIDGLSYLIGGLMAGSFLVRTGDSGFRLSPLLGVLLILLLNGVISIAWNDHEVQAGWRWYFIALCFSAFIVLGAADFLKDKGPEAYTQVLVNALWWGALVYSITSLLRYYGFLQLVAPWMEASTGRMGGMWAQPNLTTTTAWLGLLCSITRFNWRLNPYFLVGSVTLFGWVIACAASRMSWLFAIGLFILIGLSYLPALRNDGVARERLVLAISVIAVVFLVLVVPILNQSLRQWLMELGLLSQSFTAALVERSLTQDSARLSELTKFLTAIPDFSPLTLLLGVGPGGYANFSARAELGMPTEGLIQAAWLHSHNLFTMVFVELGLIGVILVLGLFSVIGWRLLRQPIDKTNFFLAGALGLIFIHSNLEFPLWRSWFLLLFWLLVLPLFPVRAVRSDVKALKPIVAVLIGTMSVALLVNVGTQFQTIVRVASKQTPTEADYFALKILSRDSLMGPYATLRRYRDFAPEMTSLGWQLKEVRRLKFLQPRDLVMVREVSLLLLAGNIDAACDAAENTAFRFPKSAPIIFEHALKAELEPFAIEQIAACIEAGLLPWNETLESISAQNARYLDGVDN